MKIGSWQRVLKGAIFFLLTILVAVIGYMYFGWGLIDAFYMTVITIFGVGYGEVKPLETSEERIFTVVVIISGFISVGYIVGGVVQMMMEGEINKALQKRKKNQGMDQLKNHVIVCGFGRVGQILAKQLFEEGKGFIVLDTNEARVEKAESLGYFAMVGNGSEEETLDKARVQYAKNLATVLPDDAANVLITLTAKSLNPSMGVIARGELPETEKKLRLAGADHVVLPSNISAKRISHLITRPNMNDFLEGHEQKEQFNYFLKQIHVELEEFVVTEDSGLVGGTLSHVQSQGDAGKSFLIVALQRASGELVSRPSLSESLEKGDVLFILGYEGSIPELTRKYLKKKQVRYRGSGRS